MSDEHGKASSKKAKGSLKEAIGKLTGDSRVEAEGKAEQNRAAPATKSSSKRKP